jgi:hypothetical protein
VASVPNRAKPGIGAGGVLVVLLAIGLALGARHHLAVSSGGNGGAQVIPHVAGTTGDPCRDKPDDHLAMDPITAPRSARSPRFTLDCGTWRDTWRKILRDGPRRPTARQIARCMLATIRRGVPSQLRSADSYSWRWGPGADDVAVVTADLAGRIAFMTAGGVPGTGPWRACADAAKS